MVLLYICSKIDAYEKTKVIEKTKEEKIEKLKDEIKKQAQVIEKLEDERKKQTQVIEKLENEKKEREQEGLFVSVKKDGIHLSDAKIINKDADLQSAIFRVLLHVYADEFFSGERIYVNVQQICSLLEAEGIFLEDPENQIHSSIYYIRTSIKSAHKNLKTGSVISLNPNSASS